MRVSLAEGKYKWDGNDMRRNLAFLRNRKEARTVLWRALVCEEIRNLPRGKSVHHFLLKKALVYFRKSQLN